MTNKKPELKDLFGDLMDYAKTKQDAKQEEGTGKPVLMAEVVDKDGKKGVNVQLSGTENDIVDSFIATYEAIIRCISDREGGDMHVAIFNTILAAAIRKSMKGNLKESTKGEEK